METSKLLTMAQWKFNLSMILFCCCCCCCLWYFFEFNLSMMLHSIESVSNMFNWLRYRNSYFHERTENGKERFINLNTTPQQGDSSLSMVANINIRQKWLGKIQQKCVCRSWSVVVVDSKTAGNIIIESSGCASIFCTTTTASSCKQKKEVALV